MQIHSKYKHKNMAVYFILYRFLYYHLILNYDFVAFQITQIPTFSIICQSLAENYCSQFLKVKRNDKRFCSWQVSETNI